MNDPVVDQCNHDGHDLELDRLYHEPRIFVLTCDHCRCVYLAETGEIIAVGVNCQHAPSLLGGG